MNNRFMTLVSLAAMVAGAATALPAADAPRPLRALYVTGGCCHDYNAEKRIITEGVSARAPVEWTIVQEGGSGTKRKDIEKSLYQNPDWAKGFDVVMHNECFADDADLDFVEKVLAPHRAGTPAVVLHCTMHTFRALKTNEFREFLGVTSMGHGPQHPLDVADADAEGEEIPDTYVPFRNANLLAMAVSYAEAEGCEAVFIGAHSEDFSGYPDCRPAFFDAFERVVEVGVQGRGHREIHRLPAVGEHVGPGRVEVGVRGDDIARLEEGGKEHVLRAPPLVGGQDVREPRDPLNGIAKPGERPAPGVGLVPFHERRPLGLGHRPGPGVGEEVHVHVIARQVECVVPRLAKPALPFPSRQKSDRLDDLDLVRLRPPRVVHGSRWYPGSTPVPLALRAGHSVHRVALRPCLRHNRSSGQGVKRCRRQTTCAVW